MTWLFGVGQVPVTTGVLTRGEWIAPSFVSVDAFCRNIRVGHPILVWGPPSVRSGQGTVQRIISSSDIIVRFIRDSSDDRDDDDDDDQTN